MTSQTPNELSTDELTTGGLLVVDKPGGMTSHDVVARLRKLIHTKRVGHAGTLDPLATGVLVIGVGKATRLLGHLTLAEKQYLATIRLGQDTSTCDAEGSVTGGAPAGHLDLAGVRAAAAALTGQIQQVPPAVSAIKVGGTRAYKLAREGAAPVLAPRTVTVSAFGVLAARREGDLLDVDVSVTCSSGTYIRALARDAGAALGVGGHVTVLRRTRSGSYDLGQAQELDALGSVPALIPLAQAAAGAFPSRQLTDAEARSLAHGGQLAGGGDQPGPVAAFSPDGTLIALVENRGDQARPLAVFVP
jgi:tRNA pseudouridine55 synthase